jgi:hypothetical protein
MSLEKGTSAIAEDSIGEEGTASAPGETTEGEPGVVGFEAGEVRSLCTPAATTESMCVPTATAALLLTACTSAAVACRPPSDLASPSAESMLGVAGWAAPPIGPPSKPTSGLESGRARGSGDRYVACAVEPMSMLVDEAANRPGNEQPCWPTGETSSDATMLPDLATNSGDLEREVATISFPR